MTVANRVVVSPMAQYSAVDGVPNDWHFVHYASRAMGGAGLVYVEMTCPSADARISLGCTGLWNEPQEREWKRLADFVHANSGAKLCMQLGHAGRKGSTQLGWEEADRPLPNQADNWPVFSASAIPYFPGVSQMPVEVDRAQMARITADFQRNVRTVRVSICSNCMRRTDICSRAFCRRSPTYAAMLTVARSRTARGFL
jgi:anthraniloyl-CoA monooxygenase